MINTPNIQNIGGSGGTLPSIIFLKMDTQKTEFGNFFSHKILGSYSSLGISYCNSISIAYTATIICVYNNYALEGHSEWKIGNPFCQEW